ncbi:Ig-like domain-containing protein [Paenibacillus sp. PAMC21692]|uniref:Ig-like domain-containing protein n=1 Tax=Paenibacillus sp. PAMC21692 TaxID=2762320 RepID=UPI0021C4A828|nr:Ig-like domain-containing protein [Paenibacillus sp. PAMC21692]
MKSWSLSFKDARRWLAATLALALMLGTFGGVAQAAEDTVTGIEMDYEDADYNSVTSSLEMFVEDDKVNVTVLASISGSTSKKDVTTEAAWKTSNSSAVKVDKGVLTGVGSGTATITATYKGYSATIKAKSDFVYDEVILLQNGSTAPTSIADIKLGDESLVFELQGKKGSAEPINISAEATWTSSSSSVATVDEGRITLVGAGTATITAKFKGKSDTIKLTITSPYKSIEIGPEQPGDLLDMEIGSDDRKLIATASPKTGGTLVVTDEAKWTSANTKVATVDKGVVTAVGAGKTTITVSHLGVTDTLSVVVRTPYQSIRLSPEKEFHMLLQDSPLQIKAEVLDNKNEKDDVTAKGTWTSSDVSVAIVSQGKVTPKGVGTTKITISHLGISRSIDVTVYPSIRKIKAEKTEIDGFKGISGELPKITATTFDGSTFDISKLVKWTNSDDEIAELDGTKWTAKALGETTFTATAQGYEAEVTLTVHLKPVKLIAETKDLSIITGKSSDLPKVSVIYEDGEEADISKSIEWKTTSDNILLLEKSMKGLEASTVTLTGTYLNKTVSVRVKIEEEIVRFEVDPTIIELNPNRSKSIKVYGYYKDGKKVSIGTKMNWTVANSNIATVSGTSSVKALNVGSTKVTGSYQGKTVEIPVLVTPKLKSLQLSSKSAQLAIGGTYSVTIQAVYLTGSPVDATTAAVWTSSKESVATVKDGKITAVSKGSATIKASFGGKSASFRVTVK